MTHEAAARQLRCPVGTIESRLSRGRGLLRTRLIRRGLTPAALGFILAARSSSAGVPCALAQTTLRAAIQLSAGKTVPAGLVSASVANLVKGAHRAMMMSRLKIAAGFLIATSVLGTGAGVLVGQERKERTSGRRSRGGSSPRGQGKAGERTEPKPGDPASIAALEQRLGALERRLDEFRWPDRARTRGETPAHRSLSHGSTPIRSARFGRDSNAWSRRSMSRSDRRSERETPWPSFSASSWPPPRTSSWRRPSSGTTTRGFTTCARNWSRREQSRSNSGSTPRMKRRRARHELSVARDRLQLYGLSPNRDRCRQGRGRRTESTLHPALTDRRPGHRDGRGGRGPRGSQEHADGDRSLRP